LLWGVTGIVECFKNLQLICNSQYPKLVYIVCIREALSRQ